MKPGRAPSLSPTKRSSQEPAYGLMTLIFPKILALTHLSDGASGCDIRISRLLDRPLILVLSCSLDQECGLILLPKDLSFRVPLHVQFCLFCRLLSRWRLLHHSR